MRINSGMQRAILALTEYLGSVDRRQARIRRLAVGGQAEVFLFTPCSAGSAQDARAGIVRDEDECGCPPRGARGSLAVRVYHAAPLVQHVILDEYESLGYLHESIQGMTVENWSIIAPAPLHCSMAQKAIIMEAVPGRPLREHMRGDEENAQLWESIARSIVAALRRYWCRSGRIFGDLNFSNILCNLSHRSLAFIDAGAPGPLWQCSHLPQDGYPATRDLAYLLYWTATSLRSTLGQGNLRRRQHWLAERVLAIYLGEYRSGVSRRQFVAEVRRCAEAHLKAIEIDWTPAGAWRRYVQRQAARTIGAVLARLASPDGDCAPFVAGSVREVAAR